MLLTIVETSIFTREISSLLLEEEYRLLQWKLVLRPEAGDLIPRSGGLRKIRWKIPGKGKRGGLRVIYYFDSPSRIYMLFTYKKNTQENLTAKQVKVLRNLVRENFTDERK